MSPVMMLYSAGANTPSPVTMLYSVEVSTLSRDRVRYPIAEIL